MGTGMSTEVVCCFEVLVSGGCQVQWEEEEFGGGRHGAL